VCIAQRSVGLKLLSRMSRALGNHYYAASRAGRDALSNKDLSTEIWAYLQGESTWGSDLRNIIERTAKIVQNVFLRSCSWLVY
jgi:hypothetical protein